MRVLPQSPVEWVVGALLWTALLTATWATLRRPIRWPELLTGPPSPRMIAREMIACRRTELQIELLLYGTATVELGHGMAVQVDAHVDGSLVVTWVKGVHRAQAAGLIG